MGHCRTEVARNWLRPLQDALGDRRVQHGIKLGLAALLALYVAEVLRLQHPNWSILTVLVMMSIRYVGSITIIAIIQVGGAIVGALIGIWLVGDYASTPAIFPRQPCFSLSSLLPAIKFGQVPLQARFRSLIFWSAYRRLL